MIANREQEQANVELMREHGWPNDIVENPQISDPEGEEPEQRCEGGVIAVMLDSETRWVTGDPVAVEQ